MSVFARADVAGVSVSPEHGGCGEFHSRPVVQGAPVPLWQLDCPACEDHLRSDPLWSANATQIPETPDEVAQHEDWKRRSEKDTQFLIALALAKLAGQEIPESMQHALSPKNALAPKAAIAGTMLCPSGHENHAGSRFCSECGAGMSGAAGLPAAAQTPAVKALDEVVDAGAGEAGEVQLETLPEERAVPTVDEPAAAQATAPDLESLTLAQLKAIAQQAGVATARSKADQIAALRAAGL